MDVIFGRLMEALERSGQARDTLVFVSSDNGPNMETWPDAGRTPFRGSKGSTWEGGVRVPGIAYWPGVIAPGRRSDGAFDLMDLYATAATLAGVPAAIPHDRFIDAVDQTGFLLADEGLSARKWVYYWMQETFSGVRVAEHKLMIAATYWEYMHDAVLPGGLSGDITTFETGHFFKCVRAAGCCAHVCARFRRRGNVRDSSAPTHVDSSAPTHETDASLTQPVHRPEGDAQQPDPQPAVL
jgi:arylsulfatase